MMDILVIENPAKKNIKNFYLNDYNYFHKNNIRMRHQKMNIINRLSKEKEIERKTHPVPKMLYSTANFKFDYNKKIENIQNNITKAKPMIDDLIHELDNFSISLNSDAEDNENNKTNKDNFFITKPEDNSKLKESIEKDIKNIKVSVSKDIHDSHIVEEIKQNDKNFKDNLQLENFERYKFSKTGVMFPKSYKPNQVPTYKGKDDMEKEYFDYRKKLKYPNLVYNNIGSFNEKFNSHLGTISHSYGKIKSRGRFAENPLLKKYMNMIPVYDIYKDIKYIENRYTDSKFRYRMLPLINQKLRNLDSLAERFYRSEQIKNGLSSLLNIENVNRKK